ncbi:rab-GTPase-TBC domain-containing protein [Obelidium mucronatum]|nr:rab-GTPase-TBC domain-containing protein [Obelidium mucronatum]
MSRSVTSNKDKNRNVLAPAAALGTEQGSKKESMSQRKEDITTKSKLPTPSNSLPRTQNIQSSPLPVAVSETSNKLPATRSSKDIISVLTQTNFVSKKEAESTLDAPNLANGKSTPPSNPNSSNESSVLPNSSSVPQSSSILPKNGATTPSTREKTPISTTEQKKLATFMSRFGSQKPSSPLATQPATAASTIISSTASTSENPTNGSRGIPFLSRIGTRRQKDFVSVGQKPVSTEESSTYNSSKMKRGPTVVGSTTDSRSIPFLSRWNNMTSSPKRTMWKFGKSKEVEASVTKDSLPTPSTTASTPRDARPMTPLLSRLGISASKSPAMSRLGTRFSFLNRPTGQEAAKLPAKTPTTEAPKSLVAEKSSPESNSEVATPLPGGLSTSKIQLPESLQEEAPKPKELAIVTRTGKTLKFQKKPTPPNTPSPPPPLGTAEGETRSSPSSSDVPKATLASLLMKMAEERAAAATTNPTLDTNVPGTIKSPLGKEINPSITTGDAGETSSTQNASQATAPSIPFMSRLATRVATSKFGPVMARFRSKMPESGRPATPAPRTDPENEPTPRNSSTNPTPSPSPIERTSFMTRIATSFASLRPSLAKTRPATPTAPQQYHPKHLAEFAEVREHLDSGVDGTLAGNDEIGKSPATSSEFSRGSFKIRLSMGSNHRSKLFGGGSSSKLAQGDGGLDIEAPSKLDLFGGDRNSSRKSASISSTPPPMTKQEIFMAKMKSRLVTPNTPVKKQQSPNLEKKESLSKRVKFPEFRRSNSLKSNRSNKSVKSPLPGASPVVPPSVTRHLSSPASVPQGSPLLNSPSTRGVDAVPLSNPIKPASATPVTQEATPANISYVPPSVVLNAQPASQPTVTALPQLPSPVPTEENIAIVQGSNPAHPATSERHTFERASVGEPNSFLNLGRSFTSMKQKLAFHPMKKRSVTNNTVLRANAPGSKLAATPRPSTATAASLPCDMEVATEEENLLQPRTDLYGFILCQISKANETRQVLRDKELERGRALSWSKAGIVSNGGSSCTVTERGVVMKTTDSVFELDAEKLVEQVAHGIPHQWRGPAWYNLITTTSDISKAMTAEQLAVYNKNLIQEFKNNCETPSPYLDDILDDVDSTVTVFPFRTEKLKRVLTALSHHDEKCGYVGSMRGVAAMFLMVMDEESAFVALVHLYFAPTVRVREAFEPDPKFSLADYYANGWPKFRQVAFIHDRLLEAWVPHIKKKLDKHTITAMQYATQWHLTMFEVCNEPSRESQSPLIPFRILIRLWDLIFVWGFSALPVISAAIVKVHELSLSNMNATEILGFLRGCVEQQHPLAWTNEQEDKFFKMVQKMWVDSHRVKQPASISQPFWSASAGSGVSLMERAKVDWMMQKTIR